MFDAAGTCSSLLIVECASAVVPVEAFSWRCVNLILRAYTVALTSGASKATSGLLSASSTGAAATAAARKARVNAGRNFIVEAKCIYLLVRGKSLVGVVEKKCKDGESNSFISCVHACLFSYSPTPG